MRRDKAATRIFLILSLVHVAAAAPAVILQRSVEVTKDVTPGLEKRANLDDESSHPFPQMDNNLPSTSGTLPSKDDTSPAPGDPKLHSDPPAELGTPQLHIDQPPTLGTPQLQDGLPPKPGASPSLDDPLPASGAPQLHNDQPPTPPPSSDDTLPGSGTLQLKDETSPAPGDPELHSDPPPELGIPQLQPPTSGTPQLQDDLPPTPGTPPPPENPLAASGNPQLHNDRPPTPGAPPSQDDLPSASEDPQLHDHPWWHHNWSPPGEMLRGESSGTAEISPLHNYLSWYRLEGMLQGGSSGAPPLHDDPWSHYDPLRFWHQNDSPSPRPMLQSALWGALPEPDDSWWQHANWASPGETLYESSETSSTLSGAPQLQNDLPPVLGSSQVHDDPPPALGALGIPQVHDNPPPASGTPQLHDNGLEEFDSSYRWHNDFRVIEGASSSSDFDSEEPMPVDSEAPPLDSETPPLHSETPPPLDSETPPPLDPETPPSLHSETPPPLHSETLPLLDSETPPSLHSETPPPLHSETPPTLESEALPSAPETHKFFNDALKQKLKVYAGVGAVAGVSAGLALGVDKLIKGHSHGSYVSLFYQHLTESQTF
jgi:hypothetical protein